VSGFATIAAAVVGVPLSSARVQIAARMLRAVVNAPLVGEVEERSVRWWDWRGLRFGVVNARRARSPPRELRADPAR
jgi:hypothetical protein